MRKFLFVAFATVLFADVLSVSTTSLPAAVPGIDYSAPLVAAGGVQPYAWAVTDGAICDGLALSEAGVINGKATAVQTCNFTVTVTDGQGVTATRDMSLTVRYAGTVISGGVAISGSVVIR